MDDIVAVIFGFFATIFEGILSWIQDSKMKTWQVVAILVVSLLVLIVIAFACISFF